MKTIDFSYFIERYNAGEMSAKEEQWFHKELESNDKLRKEVTLRKKSDEVLKNQDIISLRNKLQKIENERVKIIPVKKRRLTAYLTYAAVISILVVIGSVSLLSSNNLSNDEIMDRYYKSYEPSTTARSASVKPDSDFSLALDYYKTHDYSNAALHFKKVVEKNPKNMQSRFLSGVSNFENQKYPEAEESFDLVIKDGRSMYIETSKWYLALCYIKTNEKAKALNQLEIISNENGIYKKDAKKIIRSLK